jgi:hypothetical protein
MTGWNNHRDGSDRGTRSYAHQELRGNHRQAQHAPYGPGQQGEQTGAFRIAFPPRKLTTLTAGVI